MRSIENYLVDNFTMNKLDNQGVYLVVFIDMPIYFGENKLEKLGKYQFKTDCTVCKYVTQKFIKNLFHFCFLYIVS